MPTEAEALESASAGETVQEEIVQDGAIQNRQAQDGAVRDRSALDGQAPHNPIRIDADTCVKCDLCDWICPGDLIYKKPDDRETLPEVRYPDECWYCGLCQSICPVDAITIIFPNQMIRCRTDVTTLLGKVVE